MKTEVINLRISKEAKKGLEELAAEYGKTVSAYLMECYSNYIFNQVDDGTMSLEKARKLTRDLF